MTHFVNSVARAALSAKSLSELLAMQAATVEAGNKAKAAMNTVDGNRAVSVAVRGGRHVNVSAAQSAYNACRENWKDLETIIREKRAS